MKKQEVIMADPHEIEDLIKKHYGIKEFNIYKDLNCFNNYVILKNWNGPLNGEFENVDDEENIQGIINGTLENDGYGITEAFMNDMINKGFLESGVYCMHMSY